MRSRPPCLAVLAGLLIACGTPTGGPTGNRSGLTAGSNPAEGPWGGPDVSLDLAEAGGTLKEFPCTKGTIDAGWTLNEDGSLSGTGQQFFARSVPPGGQPDHPARYEGALRDGTLTLTVILLDVPDTLGPFEMHRGWYAVSDVCY
jgi:hypothetical protein